MTTISYEFGRWWEYQGDERTPITCQRFARIAPRPSPVVSRPLPVEPVDIDAAMVALWGFGVVGVSAAVLLWVVA